MTDEMAIAEQRGDADELLDGQPRRADLELTIILRGERGRIVDSLVDPCESCGQPVSLFSLAPLIELVNGAPAPRMQALFAAPQWQEVHQLDEPGTFAVLYRTHTRERCQLVRAGTPEPLDDDPED